MRLLYRTTQLDYSPLKVNRFNLWPHGHQRRMVRYSRFTTRVQISRFHLELEDRSSLYLEKLTPFLTCWVTLAASMTPYSSCSASRWAFTQHRCSIGLSRIKARCPPVKVKTKAVGKTNMLANCFSISLSMTVRKPNLIMIWKPLSCQDLRH